MHLSSSSSQLVNLPLTHGKKFKKLLEALVETVLTMEIKYWIDRKGKWNSPRGMQEWPVRVVLVIQAFTCDLCMSIIFMDEVGHIIE